jgi:hypothetical protein
MYNTKGFEKLKKHGCSEGKTENEKDCLGIALSALAIVNAHACSFKDWSEYEAYCYREGIEPSYSDYENLVQDGHCDFDKEPTLEETLELFENN